MSPRPDLVEQTIRTLGAESGPRILLADAPSGHGRSELLRGVASGLAERLGTRVVAPRSPPRRGEPSDVAEQLADALDAGRPPSRISAALVQALERPVGGGATVVVVDQLHRVHRDDLDVLADLSATLPERTWLLLGGAGLLGLVAAEMLADGRAHFIGESDLPFLATRADSITAVLREAAALDLAPDEQQLLGVLVDAGVTDRRAAELVCAQLPGRAEVSALSLLPLARTDATSVRLDDRWREVVAPPDHEVLRTASAALCGHHLQLDELEEAGRAALAARSPDMLCSVVRAALATQPPAVGAMQLREWLGAGLLATDDPHHLWLSAANAATHGVSLDVVFDLYEAARTAFAAGDDPTAEIAVGLAASTVARRRGDLGSILLFVLRAQELAASGVAEAVGPALLGEALGQQMSGDPQGALDTLGKIPPGALAGDWAAQVDMVRGTNLVLLGRLDEAEERLERATGSGGPWSEAVALDLVASAKWLRGDRIGALDDLDTAERLADRNGASSLRRQIRAERTAMLASGGDPAVVAATSTSEAAVGPDEVEVLDHCARVLAAVALDDLDGARALAAALPTPARATQSAHWVVALQTALVPSADPVISRFVATHSALRPALDAGRAAAMHLAGGDRVAARHRAYLPSRWCEESAAIVQVTLLGGAEVRRDRVPVHHKAWDRARVRELCCYLALVGDGSRELAAERLWPELDGAAAARNLRVTLSYLLDVLDPGRPRGSSDLLDESFTFARTPRLRIDLRDASLHAAQIVTLAAAGDTVGVMEHARRLDRLPRGALMGGAPLGEWVESIDRDRRDALLRAVGVACTMALREGDPELAASLARRGLDEDPWAERLHQVVVRARLATDDLDGARRALSAAVEALTDLGVRPEQATVELARQAGVDLPGS